MRVTDEDQELQENASELIVSLKHGTDSVVEGHIKLFKEQNSLKPQVLSPDCNTRLFLSIFVLVLKPNIIS